MAKINNMSADFFFGEKEAERKHEEEGNRYPKEKQHSLMRILHEKIQGRQKKQEKLEQKQTDEKRRQMGIKKRATG